MDFFRKNISYLYETGKIEEDLFQQFSENQHPELNSILLISDIAGITTDNLLKQDLHLFCIYDIGIPKVNELDAVRSFQKIYGCSIKRKSDLGNS